MSRFLACCLICLASPALAMDIFEDYTLNDENFIPGEQYKVYGDATLTISGDPHSVSKIFLYDTADLNLQGGWLRGGVEIWGTDNSLTVTGGELRDGWVESFTEGHSTLDFRGGKIWSKMAFYEEHSTQDVFVDLDAVMADSHWQMVPAAVESMSLNAIGSNVRYGLSDFVVLLTDEASVKVPQDVDWLLESRTDVPGDANSDGKVDLTDLNLVRDHFGHFFGDSIGDVSPYDGRIDLSDLNRVRNGFGGHAVPEPSSLVLMALGLFSLAGIPSPRRRWRLNRTYQFP
jgi:hypothetical protein